MSLSLTADKPKSRPPSGKWVIPSHTDQWKTIIFTFFPPERTSVSYTIRYRLGKKGKLIFHARALELIDPPITTKDLETRLYEFAREKLQEVGLLYTGERPRYTMELV
jgi:hypothetical protein